MLDRAAGTNAYDNLVNAELTEYMTGQKEAFDVIVSADTLCYFGALEPVFRAAARALKPGGLLAFTLEDAGETSSGWQLNLHGRYAHPRTYVERALAGAGLSLRSISAVVLRTEGRNAVAGHLVLAKKTLGR
jgi:predicted TPR repeat methyltransferase